MTTKELNDKSTAWLINLVRLHTNPAYAGALVGSNPIAKGTIDRARAIIKARNAAAFKASRRTS